MSGARVPELKPCPFCGGPGSLVKFPDQHLTGDGRRAIGCFSPRCLVRPRVMVGAYVPPAAKRWNRRVDKPPPGNLFAEFNRRIARFAADGATLEILNGEGGKT